MNLVIVISAILGLAAAAPSPPRVLPQTWRFDILSLKGPGCASKGDRITRPTFGANTVDGSEIYYWHVAYPSMSADIGPGVDTEKSHTWCETTIKYTETENTPEKTPIADYRLRLHKNGTRILSRYDLDEGVSAKWKFTYFTDDHDLAVSYFHYPKWNQSDDFALILTKLHKLYDEITVKGPIRPGVSNENHVSSNTGPRWPVPECGTATIRYRTDVWLESDDEKASGRVIADRVSVEGQKYTEMPYGVEQGFSYDWEKCEK